MILGVGRAFSSCPTQSTPVYWSQKYYTAKEPLSPQRVGEVLDPSNLRGFMGRNALRPSGIAFGGRPKKECFGRGRRVTSCPIWSVVLIAELQVLKAPCVCGPLIPPVLSEVGTFLAGLQGAGFA